jgi:uncharacterized Zn-finger protein
LTAAGKLSDIESVMEKADDLHGGEKSSLTGSTKLKVNQHGTSNDGQSTQWENKRHVCDVCNKVFTHNCYLKRHRITHNVSSGGQSGEDTTVLYCDICGLACYCMSQIIIHMRTHTGEKPYACKVCGKAFSRHSDRTRHMRTHTGEKPHVCEVCKRAFSWRSLLATHMCIHTGKKPYACKVCNSSFRFHNQLTKQVRTRD